MRFTLLAKASSLFFSFVLLFLGIYKAISIAPVQAAAGSNKTAQGIMVNLDAAGNFAIVGNQTYKFNLDDPTLADKNGSYLPASSYFSTSVAGPLVSCKGSTANCDSSNQPATPSTPDVDSSKITAPNGVCEKQRCTFLDGGTLTSSDYTQAVTVNGLNGKGNWIFTWTYTVSPKTEYDTDANPDNGVQVAPFTAWYLFSSTSNGTAHLDFTAKIAGESVLVSKQFPFPGKFSFSLLEPGLLGPVNRIQNLSVSVKDSALNVISSTFPGSTISYPTDFTYTTNAGSNGTTPPLLLRDGDARTILNTDVFAGNDNGGADGSALALGTMDPVSADLPAGDYTVTLTGTVKGNAASADLPFTVSQAVHIITPGCGNNN